MEGDQSQTRSKRPSNNAIKQQRMKAFQPIHTFKSSLITFACLFTLFVIFGLVTLISALQVIETSVRYDNKPGCDGNWTDPGECNVTISIDDEMESPVFLYYEMHNYFQNHRMYMKSRDDKQLSARADGTAQFCAPIETMGDVGPRCGNKSTGFFYCTLSGERLSRSNSANPCGLMAKSLFNDTYAMRDLKGTAVEISEQEIAWSSDLDYLYDYPSNHTSDQWTDVLDEHFAVWMRSAAFPIFRKLWGVIHTNLKGNYTFQIASNYDVSKWDGEKHLILSTANAFGGRNPFLGIVYLSAAGVAACMMVIFVLRYKFGARTEVDLNNLKWD